MRLKALFFTKCFVFITPFVTVLNFTCYKYNISCYHLFMSKCCEYIQKMLMIVAVYMYLCLSGFILCVLQSAFVSFCSKVKKRIRSCAVKCER